MPPGYSLFRQRFRGYWCIRTPDNIVHVGTRVPCRSGLGADMVPGEFAIKVTGTDEDDRRRHYQYLRFPLHAVAPRLAKARG